MGRGFVMQVRRGWTVAGLVAILSLTAACGAAKESGKSPALGSSSAPTTTTSSDSIEPEEPPATKEGDGVSDEMGVPRTECPIIGAAAKPSCDADPESSVKEQEGTTVRYGDGLVFTLISVRDLKNNELGFEVPKSATLVRVDLLVKNGSLQTLRFDGRNIYFKLQYGDARFDAEGEGYAGDTRTLMDPQPNRIAAGTSLRLWQTFRVEKKDLGNLAVQPTDVINPHLPFSFVDVEAVLK
jgi:hypothetical protein